MKKDIDFKELSRPLKDDEIEFRLQSINKGKYATILAYKDARTDMAILDEIVGHENWQKDYKIINNRLYCGVAIKYDGEWIWKWDVGTESDVEKVKGEASDAFKRSCFNWGVGRELYSFPHITVKLSDSECEVRDNKVYPTFGFKLKEWQWKLVRDKEGVLTQLTATFEGKERFNWKANSAPTQAPKQPQPTNTPPAQQSAPKAAVNLDKERAKAQATFNKLIEKNQEGAISLAKNFNFVKGKFGIEQLDAAQLQAFTTAAEAAIKLTEAVQ